jgi:antitoxin component YwqK of YwqJK toxin-antitoxin module
VVDEDSSSFELWRYDKRERVCSKLTYQKYPEQVEVLQFDDGKLTERKLWENNMTHFVCVYFFANGNAAYSIDQTENNYTILRFYYPSGVKCLENEIVNNGAYGYIDMYYPNSVSKFHIDWRGNLAIAISFFPNGLMHYTKSVTGNAFAE